MTVQGGFRARGLRLLAWEAATRASGAARAFSPCTAAFLKSALFFFRALFSFFLSHLAGQAEVRTREADAPWTG